MRETFVGFDSAWADKKPGALCSATLEDDRLVEYGPEPVHFEQAKSVIEEWCNDADYILVAVDQPTIVPNSTGMRPVELVARSIKKGVQPANLNLPRFDGSAPIWPFLDEMSRLDANEEPLKAQSSSHGLHVIEVFPGLALPALLMVPPPKYPMTLHYNPQDRQKFSIDDWRQVAGAVSMRAKEVGLSALAEWAAEQLENPKPKKSDQDKLDALICLIVGVKWKRRDADMVVLGDWRGHMVTPLSRCGKTRVVDAAKRQGVPIGGGSWAPYHAALRYFDRKHYDACEWLGHPSTALDGETPLERAKTPTGAQDVLDLIGRLEHGIPT